MNSMGRKAAFACLKLTLAAILVPAGRCAALTIMSFRGQGYVFCQKRTMRRAGVRRSHIWGGLFLIFLGAWGARAQADPVICAGWTTQSWTASNGSSDNRGTATLSTNTTGKFYTSTGAPEGYSSVFVSTGWDGGANSKYWQVSFSTHGFQSLTVSSQQNSTDLNFYGWDGPRDFKLQYSLNGSTWTDVSGGALTLTGGWTSGGRLTNLALPAALNDQATAYLRWIMSTNNSVGSNGFTSEAQSKIAVIEIYGTEIPVAPTDITLSNDSLHKSSPADTEVGTLSAVDENSGDTHTFSLVSGDGSTDNGSFWIDGDVLRIQTQLSEGTYSIRVNVNDGTDDFAKVFDIEIVGGYLPITGGNTTFEDYITNVTFAGIDSDTDIEDGAYGDYTAQVASVSPGQTYNFSCTVNVGDVTFPAVVMAWFDWNQNESFDDDGEAYEIGSNLGTLGANTASASILVPESASAGVTRMRVVSNADTDMPPPPNAGSTDYYGEAEDYSVEVNVCSDSDGDGFGMPGNAGCPGGAQADCDDSDPSTYPGATEICDGIDNNCDGIFMVGEVDSDGDGILDCADTCPLDADNDADSDGVCGNVDNCPAAANADQADADSDGLGNTCDSCPNDADNDADSDGVCGDVDNCPAADNADQADADADGLGDACDSCANDADNDADGDGVCGDVDNCPAAANADQADADSDGLGNTCDSCPNDAGNDADGDGVCGDVDNCPAAANADQADADSDGLGDTCDSCPNDADNDADSDGVCGDVDNCPAAANADQADADSDGLGDTCDSCANDADNDADSDGVCGDVDNCPAAANADQADADSDGLGDTCDSCPNDADNDADSDGVCGDVDNCPAAANADQADADSDGLGDTCDSCANDADNDADGDGVCGDVDNCPAAANANQADADNDGLGDACDVCQGNNASGDTDGDGVCDDTDAFPQDPDEDTDSDGDGTGDNADACPDNPRYTLEGSNCNCGDGTLDPGEVCDDGGILSGDGCNSDCNSDESCGNNILDIAAGEACDDGNTADGDGCQSNCALPGCGDGLLDDWEECDDGNTVSGDGCNATCTSAEICGNGIMDTAAGEACDDSNSVDDDGCQFDCALPDCGNGVLDDWETCDDGNQFSGDGCNSTCASDEVCGNLIVDTAVGGTCDDGNHEDEDGCNSACVVERCGDNVVQAGLGEVCDDGNTVDGDGCNATCTATITCVTDKYGRSEVCINTTTGDWEWNMVTGRLANTTFSGSGVITQTRYYNRLTHESGAPWYLNVIYGPRRLTSGSFSYRAGGRGPLNPAIDGSDTLSTRVKHRG